MMADVLGERIGCGYHKARGLRSHTQHPKESGQCFPPPEKPSLLQSSPDTPMRILSSRWLFTACLWSQYLLCPGRHSLSGFEPSSFTSSTGSIEMGSQPPSDCTQNHLPSSLRWDASPSLHNLASASQRAAAFWVRKTEQQGPWACGRMT